MLLLALRRHRSAIVLGSALLLFLGGMVVRNAWRAIPRSNTSQTKFDAILVLGTPCAPDGSLAPEQRARMQEGIREWKRGVAPMLIVSGGAAHNHFVEADCMGRFALEQSVPREALIEERRAQNTVENMFYATRILQAHGWSSVEVVSSPSHMPRAALILSHFPLRWSTRDAPWPPEFGPISRFLHDVRESLYTVWLRIHGLPRSEYPVKTRPEPADTTQKQVHSFFRPESGTARQFPEAS